ncbi:MAG: ABC transporter ATP-binding protein [Agathobacter sp.]
MNPILEVTHVNFAYHSMQGEIPALSDITFSIYPGDFIAIVGPSGCGKSTLLNLMSGLLEPESGVINFKGEPLTEEMRNHIGYMLQSDQLFEWRSIFKNVCLGLEVRKQLNETSKAYARQLIADYGLEKFMNAKPSQLSGGMRQRAALVRTLVLKPDLLFLDEPFSALDYQTRLQVGNDIGVIIKEKEKTAVLVTHDLAEAVSLADHVLILSNRPGRVQQYLTLDFPGELTPMERRNTELFQTYFNLIWKELNKDDESLQTGSIP